MNDIKDIQCQNISLSIKNLLGILDDELVENILEIKSNIDSENNYVLLKRLERSIDQFLKRDKNLFYIGFLGHYSSGKSSTINSLLELRGGQHERNENINPTDDQITLITSQQNSEQVVRLIRSGQVPVVISSVEGNVFLIDKVVMDTPGSGDPAILEEIVRDSLPLCDLIVYCISAANPLDNSDIPLLREKESNLQEIPTLYVITRGSEFKKDILAPLSSINIDEPNCHQSLSLLAARMREAVNTIQLTYEDFIIIDNKENYNIELLFDKITAFVDPNYQNIISLHSHKVDFFVRTLEKVKKYFVDAINDKLETIVTFVNKAKANIAEYDQTTLIGTDKLINDWKTIDDRIKQVTEGALGENVKLHALLDTSYEFLKIPLVKSWKDVLTTNLNFKIRRKVNSMLSTMKTKIYDLKESFGDQLYMTLSKRGIISKEQLSESLDKELKIIECYLNTIDCDHDYTDLYISLKSYFREKGESNRRILESLQGRLRNYSPEIQVEKHIEISKSVLSDIFKSYHDGVVIYKVAAFSNEAKNYINKLGLSKGLDALDSQNLNIDLHKQITIEKIFKNYQEEVIEFKQSCIKLNDQLNLIKLDYPIVDTASTNDLTEPIEYLQGELGQGNTQITTFITDKIKEFFLLQIDRINETLLSNAIEEENEIRAIKKQRTIYYLKIILPVVILVSIGFIVFSYMTNAFSNNLSIGWQWIIGILSNVAFAAISALIASRNDKYPMYRTNIVNNHNNEKKKIIYDVINRNFADFLLKSESDLNQKLVEETQKTYNVYIDKLLSKTSNETAYEIHSRLFQDEKELKTVIQAYSSLINTKRNVVNLTLNNIKTNKEILIEQSKEIKESSINPSFKLLFSTQENIQKVKTLVDTVSFI